MSAKQPVTVAVGRFGCVVGRGLMEILGGDRGLRVVASGLDYDGLAAMLAEGGARVVVLDEDSGVTPSIPAGLRGACANVGLVVLAHRPSRAQVTRLLAYGVSVCLSTDASAREIVRGVRRAANAGEVFVSTSPHQAYAARAVGMRSLTRREDEVLGLISTGHKNAEIAHQLQISVETARTHTQHVYRKLGVSSRGELLGVER